MKEKIIQLCYSQNIQSFLTQSGKVYMFELDVDDESYSEKYSIFCKLIDSKHFNQEKVIQLTCSNNICIALTQSGNVYEWELSQVLGGINDPRKIDASFFDFEKVEYLSASIFYSVFAITESKKVYTWGLNVFGQLGTGCGTVVYENPVVIDPNTYNNEKPLKICCGYYETLMLTESGNVYTCGYNKKSDLGLGHNKIVNTFEQIKINNECCIPTSVSSSIKIKDISCSMFPVALSQSGKMYTWGKNTIDQMIPNQHTSLGTSHVIADSFLRDEFIVRIGTNHCNCYVVTNIGNFYSWNDNPMFNLVNEGLKKVYKKRFKNNERIVCAYLDKYGSDSYLTSLALTQSGKIIAWEDEKNENYFVDFCFSYPCSFEKEKIYNNDAFEDVQIEF